MSGYLTQPIKNFVQSKSFWSENTYKPYKYRDCRSFWNTFGLAQYILTIKDLFMSKLLYVFAIIFIAAWSYGIVALHARNDLSLSAGLIALLFAIMKEVVPIWNNLIRDLLNR